MGERREVRKKKGMDGGRKKEGRKKKEKKD